MSQVDPKWSGACHILTFLLTVNGILEVDLLLSGLFIERLKTFSAG